MKKIWLIALVAITVFVSCGEDEIIPDETELVINFLSHPQGGYLVSLITCSFDATLLDSDDVTPITATIYWMYSATSSGSGNYVWSTTYSFTQTTTETYYMTHGAEPGYVFTGYFWALIQWQNEDGSSDEATSNKAYCYN